MSKDIDEQKLKQILDGVWHSRRVDDVVPEIEALIAAREQATYERGLKDGQKQGKYVNHRPSPVNGMKYCRVANKNVYSCDHDGC